MKNIPEPNLSDVQKLTPGEMNKIHFGGNSTPLTPEQLKKLASDGSSVDTACGQDAPCKPA